MRQRLKERTLGKLVAQSDILHGRDWCDQQLVSHGQRLKLSFGV